jgi:uncharacterized cupredoxin-like copper-binding protein
MGGVLRRYRRRAAIAGCATAAVVLFAGCSGDESGGEVAVTLQEFAVGTQPTSVSAGEVTFNVTNAGPDDVHEFVVIRTDLDATELPTDETGAVDEEGEGIDEVVDEIEDIEVGANPTLTVDLEAGSYVLICNIYDEDEQESHYQEGMRTALTVE